MRVAIVDLGTNTFNLLIADIEKGGFNLVYAGREVVKLGEGGITEGKIGDKAFERGVKAFKNHIEIINQKKVDQVKALATSAIRDARNGADFTQTLREATGIEIEVIDGLREAELIFKGNRLAVELGEQYNLIMDIGGGSTEFIIANNQTIFWKHSFKLGVARLLEKFKPEDPISNTTLKSVVNYLETELAPLSEALQKMPVISLVGSSGGFESVVDMIAARFNRNSVTTEIHSYEVLLDEYEAMSKNIIHSTVAQREKVPGLIPMRRDMIVLTYLLIDVTLRLSGVKKFMVSSYALKEGALAEVIANNC